MMFEVTKTAFANFLQVGNFVTNKRSRNVGIYEQVLVFLDNVFQLSRDLPEKEYKNAAFSIGMYFDLKPFRMDNESTFFLRNSCFHKFSHKHKIYITIHLDGNFKPESLCTHSKHLEVIRARIVRHYDVFRVIFGNDGAGSCIKTFFSIKGCV